MLLRGRSGGTEVAKGRWAWRTAQRGAAACHARLLLLLVHHFSPQQRNGHLRAVPDDTWKRQAPAGRPTRRVQSPSKVLRAVSGGGRGWVVEGEGSRGEATGAQGMTSLGNQQPTRGTGIEARGAYGCARSNGAEWNETAYPLPHLSAAATVHGTHLANAPPSGASSGGRTRPIHLDM